MPAPSQRSSDPKRARRAAAADALVVRPVTSADLDAVVAIDADITGRSKTDYWFELLHRYGSRGRQQRFFLVAAAGGEVQGFIVGEVRDWEFGSTPCGWVYGIGVRNTARLGGVASRMFAAIKEEFRKAGVTKVRSMLALDNNLVLSFFRSQGMMAAPFLALEMDIGT